MKIAEIRAALMAINTIQTSGPINTKLAYALAKNRRALMGAAQDFEDSLKGDFTDTIAAFEKGRMDVVREHAEKDAAGNPVQIAGQFKFPADLDQAQLLEDLKAKHPGIDEAIEAATKRGREMEATDLDVSVHFIPMALWPATVDAEAFDALLPLVVEDAEPKPAEASA